MTVFTQEISLPALEGGLACDGEVLWSSLVALATGALLGVLAGMPYDVLFGLPEPACAVLRSLALTATWSCVGQVKPVQIGAERIVGCQSGPDRSVSAPMESLSDVPNPS